MSDEKSKSISRKEAFARTEHSIDGNSRGGARRRSFLTRASGALVILLPSYLSTTSVGAATEEFERESAIAAAAEYDSVAKITGAINDHGTLILRGLEKAGVLENAAISELPLSNRYTSLKQYSNAERGVFVYGGVKNGEPRTNIQVKTELSDGRELRIVVVPQIEHSYAVILDGDSKQTSITAKETEDGDVTTQSCDCMDYEYKCKIHCVSVGSCACAEFTIGSYCSDDTGGDCTLCTIDYSDCSSCSEAYSCP